MGNHNSSEKEETPTSRSGTPNSKEKVSWKTSTRPQHHASVRGRSTPVQPSATAESAPGKTTSQHIETPQLQQMLDSASPDTAARSQPVGRSSSKREKKEDPVKARTEPMNAPSPSNPVSIPSRSTPSSSTPRSRTEQSNDMAFETELEEGASSFERRYVPPAEHRPPRLPLPIADAGSTPDSPLLQPVDKAGSDLDMFGEQEVLSGEPPELRRKSSMMSTATHDDEDIGDELPPVDPTAETVPTTIEWNYSGHKIYVTGTFATWEKKYKMHHKKDGPGFATTINLPPGTHHLLFLVDEKMVTNPEMPTAVDFNNVLVNYIEIATEDVQRSRRDSKIQPVVADEKRDSDQLQPSQVPQEDDHTERDEDDEAEPVAEEFIPGDFRQIIPQALIDMDLPENDPRYHQAARIIGAQESAPPQLPSFMGRSLLNGYTPVKDDSSVLTLPNHTVLNHLMTSSVKNGVLSTSVTTRYKKKYVTTICFKPVNKSGQTKTES